MWLLGSGRKHWEVLQGMGLRTRGDLLKLPCSGVPRRFGAAMLVEIVAALGRRPDPRESIVRTPTFASRLELFARADTTEQVLHGAAVLLEAGWWDNALAGRDYFIAETADGALLWIHRERLPLDRRGEDSTAGSGWFLHGRFG